MTTTQVLLIIVFFWVLTGATASIVMGRRGHSSFTWLLVAVFLGPLAIPPAVATLRGHQDPRAGARSLREGTPGPGSVDVLVGVDGSLESVAALRAAVGLFADRIGRLTLAGVIDYDSALSGRPWGTERLAAEALERSAASVGLIEPGTVLLVGHPATALMQHAVEEGYEVLVVGRRGQGASKALLGSTATRLAHGAGIPVVIV